LEVSGGIKGVIYAFFNFLRVDVQELEASIRVLLAEF